MNRRMPLSAENSDLDTAMTPVLSIANQPDLFLSCHIESYSPRGAGATDLWTILTVLQAAPSPDVGTVLPE
jgi:hypothetical protein